LKFSFLAKSLFGQDGGDILFPVGAGLVESTDVVDEDATV
jgi:hypothetical protein